MSVKRIKWRVFTRGWWGTGARDSIPEGTMRRAIGIAAIKTSELRSRSGSTIIADLDAHSVARFNNRRFQGVVRDFYKDGTTVIQSGLDGTRLTCVRMAPTVDVEDYLFVAGGGLAFKVAPDAGATVSKWGIEPPPDGFTAIANASNFKVIDTFETAATWTAGAGIVLTDEATIKQVGTNSMKGTIAAASVAATATKTNAIDLANFSAGVPSADEDFIEMWVRVDNPANLTSLQLLFDVGAGNFAADYYINDVIPGEPLVSQSDPGGGVPTAFMSQKLGQLVYLVFTNGQPVVRVPTLSGGEGTEGSFFETTDPEVLAEAPGQISTTVLPSTLNTWTRIKLPKSSFRRIGAGTGTWANVAAVQLNAKATGAAVVYYDDLRLTGGVGMQGTYRYSVTFFNSVTGHRSDPNPNEVIVASVLRAGTVLAALPVSTDPQVDRVEIYRTVGNGVLKFRIGTVANGTVTFADNVADAATLDSRVGATLMTNIQLQLDNARPNDEWDDAWGPYAGRMWWCRSPVLGEQGTVFFSPAGRPESGSSFLVMSSDDEPTMKGIVFNASNYVFTTQGLYQIVGTTEPFVPRRVYGVPGTLWPLSVTLTPYGIAYLAIDGPRLFDGVSSKLIANEPVSLLFRQETLEDVVFNP